MSIETSRGALVPLQSVPALDVADHVRLGVGHHRQLNNAVDDRVQGEKVVALDYHNYRRPAEQRISSHDPVHAADGPHGRARAGICGGHEYVRFDRHPGTVGDRTDIEADGSESGNCGCWSPRMVRSVG